MVMFEVSSAEFQALRFQRVFDRFNLHHPTLIAVPSSVIPRSELLSVRGVTPKLSTRGVTPKLSTRGVTPKLSTPSPTLPRREEPGEPMLDLRDLTSKLSPPPPRRRLMMSPVSTTPSLTLPRREDPPLSPSVALPALTSTLSSSTLPRREEPPLALRDLTSTLSSLMLTRLGMLSPLHPLPSSKLPRREVLRVRTVMPPLSIASSPTLPRREEAGEPTLARRDLTSTPSSSPLPRFGMMSPLSTTSSPTLPRREEPPLPPTLALRDFTSTSLFSSKLTCR